MKQFLTSLWEFAKIIIIALIIVVPIRYYLMQPFFVKGQSMEPNFHHGDYLIIDEITYRMRPPQRGEVVVFKYPYDLSQRYIKRIIGLPGETVEIKEGKIVIYPKPANSLLGQDLPFVLDEESYLPELIMATESFKIQLSENEYFVLGDNRPFSSDSRRWGALPKEDIIGRALLRLWPIPALAKVEVPAY
jgi:signal peptidase I